MTGYTPEKVTDLIAEARKWASSSPLGMITAREVDRGILFARRLADTLEATVREMHERELHHFEEEQARIHAEERESAWRAERDAEYGRAESGWKTAREANRAAVKAMAERDRLHKAITEALDLTRPGASVPLGMSEVRHIDRLMASTHGILRAALEQKGNDDE